MGAFGYADDIILLAPTVYSLTKLLETANKFSQEYQVLFNPEKFQFIVFGDNEITKSGDISLDFNNIHVSNILCANHLGNSLDSQHDNSIHSSMLDFTVKVNKIMKAK